MLIVAGVDANLAVCALSGGADCDDSAPSTGRRWPCPHLQRLSLDDCNGVKSSCIRHTILARKRHAEGSLPPSPERPVKPLRRQRTHSSPGDPSNSHPRSFIQPTKLRAVDIIKCYGLSEKDIDAFKGPRFELQELNWIDTPPY